MTDTTTQFDGPAIALETVDEPAWTAATWFAVLSMAATSFALVSAEFLPAGLLTPMARDLGISEGTAGQVVTATASVGAVTALLSNVLIGKLNRKTFLVGLSALAIASNILAAFAADFWLLLLGRAGLGIALSGFWRFRLPSWRALVGTNATGRGMGDRHPRRVAGDDSSALHGRLDQRLAGMAHRHGVDGGTGGHRHAFTDHQPPHVAGEHEQQSVGRIGFDQAA